MGARVSQKELAEALGLSERTVYALIREGLPVLEEGKPGRPAVIDLALAVAWYVNREVTRRTPANREESHRERLLRAQAARIELEMASRSGHLLRADEVRVALESCFRILATNLDGAASRLAQVVAPMRVAGEIRRVLLDGFREARGLAALEIEHLAATEGRESAPEAAPKPNARRVGKSGKGSSRGKRRAGKVPK